MRNTSKPKLPPTNNNNNKRANSHTRIQPQQRGYYYSSANTQRRLQNKLNSNNNNNTNSKIEIDASSSSSSYHVTNIPLKRKWENELELYNKNNKLIIYLDNQKTKLGFILSLFKTLNNIISDTIIKKKIKIYEVNRKLQNDRIKKEKEDYEFQRNLSQQIDNALIKANQALESIKYIHKQLPKIKLNITDTSSKVIPPLSKPKDGSTLSDVIEKCQDKFNTNIQINNNNMNKYFTTFTRNKNVINIIKEKNRRLKQKHKNTLNSIFDTIYHNKIKHSMDIDDDNSSNNNDTNVNNVIKVSSLLISSLFMNLYMKVFCNVERNEHDNAVEKLYHLFSLWVIVTHMKQLFDNNNNNEQCDDNNTFNYNLNVTNIFGYKCNWDSILQPHESYFIKGFIYKQLHLYFDMLNKNCLSSNEKEIFNDDFYKMYHTLSKVEKIKCINYIMNHIHNNNNNSNNNKDNTSKEELNLFRNIESIFKNNGYYCCNICKQ